jgi:predicted ATPase
MIRKIESDERRPSRQMAELLADRLAIPDAERDNFLRMARGEFVAAMSSPIEAVPFPTLPLEDETFSKEDETLFVAREGELAQLGGFLDLALTGQGQLVFVTGEAGRGKTVLVQEFSRRAQERQADLVVAGGNCNAYSGLGDPYLPFREILGLLTGDIEDRWAAGAINRVQARRLWGQTPAAVQTLVNTGPDLIDIFIPGPPLVTRTMTATPGAEWLSLLGKLVADKAAGQGPMELKQSSLFEQYTKVLLTLARQEPLLLVLDDLQWADAGSISLLFHLGRRLSGSRILVIGIYRPSEVALGRDGERHPLESVINELQRYHGNIQVDLSRAEGRDFTNAFLDSEPNRLGEAFKEALYQHTHGHPLFTVEMLRGLRERGDLVQDEADHWVEGPTLDWDTLPIRVEGVIGERVGRLPAELQEALKVASVEGETFTAEVVARVQALEERQMIRHLSGELDKQHRLIRGQGRRQLSSSGPHLSGYRFRHILFQLYLYNSLDDVERGYLHEAVGNELEQFYGEQTEAIAVKLARHFEQAGLLPKAIGYLQEAGNRAVRLSANTEAIAHFYRALALLETLPETIERDRQELGLQIALFAPLAGAKGYGAPELGRVYTRAQELSERAGEPGQVFLVLYGLWGHNFVQGDMKLARELAKQCLTLAEKLQERALLMEGHRMMDETAFHRGELVTAREHLERTLSLYDPQLHRAHATVYGQDPGVASYSHGSWILWHLGYPDQARKMGQQAVALGEDVSHPFSLAFALCYNAELHQFCGDEQRVGELIEAAASLSTEQEFVLWLAYATVLRGWVQASRGHKAEGTAQMRQGLADLQAMSIHLQRPYFLALLAEAYGEVGKPAEGLTLLTEALALVDKGELRYYEAELYRLKGELSLMGGAEEVAVEADYRRAIDIARRQSAKSLELRAATSLSRLWLKGGRPDEARQILAEIYNWFTEGFDTADLLEGKALLDAMA